MNGIVPMREDLPKIKVQRKVEIVSVAKKIETYPLASKRLSFLQNRGISKETATKANLKFGRSWITVRTIRGRLYFFLTPTRVRQYAYKIRSIKSKGFSCNGAPQTFFNIENVKEDDCLIICEGEMDALALIESGYESCVSVPNGAVMKVSEVRTYDRNNDNKFKFLWKQRIN